MPVEVKIMQENVVCYPSGSSEMSKGTKNGNTFYIEEERSGTDRVGMANHR